MTKPRAAPDCPPPVAEDTPRARPSHRSWAGPPDHCLFIRNGARGRRGPADPNLSLIARRSRRVLNRILGVKTDDRCPPFPRRPPHPAVDEFSPGV
ncbi:hypothetical protein [Embleya sp. AB8]|uniref:hypothetical protein n=1 Tax=Embleya sp. AB8 TaxID=3156304 RepID=UPI003C723CB7